MTRLVMDASIVLAWCFEDERTAYTERVLDAMAAGAEALAPALWPLEVANALVSAERGGRITRAQGAQFLERVSGFEVSLDAANIPRAFARVLSLARECRLTAYDAAYLELAMREGLPLATLDGDLKRAAREVGVPPFGAHP